MFLASKRSKKRLDDGQVRQPVLGASLWGGHNLGGRPRNPESSATYHVQIMQVKGVSLEVNKLQNKTGWMEMELSARSYSIWLVMLVLGNNAVFQYFAQTLKLRGVVLTITEPLTVLTRTWLCWSICFQKDSSASKTFQHRQPNYLFIAITRLICDAFACRWWTLHSTYILCVLIYLFSSLLCQLL